MPARPYEIPADARAALTDAVAFDGARVTITRRIPAETWTGVKNALVKMGASFVPNSSVFEFPYQQDAAALVTAGLAAESLLAAANRDGYVPTPDEVAADLVDEYGLLYAGTGPLTVLEPSMGTGPLVRAALGEDQRREWIHVTGVELDATRAAQVPATERVSVVRSSFEEYAAQHPGHLFDRVFMNPPFSVPGNRTLWVDHLLLAWELVAAGGRLVAILPNAAMPSPRNEYRARRIKDVHGLIRRFGGAAELPRDVFPVKTVVVWLDRPPAPATDTAPVRVTRPFLNRAAAEAVPAQVIYDSWRQVDRVLRYRGDCVACHEVTWGFDDGENDPRGMLGDAAASPLRAADYDQVGADISQCFLCENDSKMSAVTVAVARERWTDTAAPEVEPAASKPVVEASGWGQLALLDV